MPHIVVAEASHPSTHCCRPPISIAPISPVNLSLEAMKLDFRLPVPWALRLRLELRD